MPIRAFAPVAALVAIVAATLPTGLAAAKPPPPPDEWDERIQPLVDFVEKDRKLDFDHPVAVEFLGEGAFKKRLRADEQFTDTDKADVEDFAASLRALGLITGDVDLLGAQTELDAETVLGFYDFETESIVIRGKNLDDIETRATVVHELTHALQDQHYGFDDLYDDADTSGEVFALDALTEGDAVFVETDYVATLSANEQDVYYGTTEETGSTPSGEAPLPDDAPAALALIDDAPYTLGLTFVIELDALGKGALEKAYRHPPVSDEQIIDPVAWGHRDRPLEVAVPKLHGGERKAGAPDELGALGLYLVLSSRIDPLVALEAATGWGGDRYRSFTRGDADCLRDTVRGDTAADTAEIADALELWAAALPAGMAQVERGETSVTLTSCATPGVTDPDADRLDRAFYFVLDTGVYNATQVLAAGESAQLASCVGRQSVSDPEFAAIEERLYFEGITEEQLPEDELARYRGLIDEAFRSCAS